MTRFSIIMKCGLSLVANTCTGRNAAPGDANAEQVVKALNTKAKLPCKLVLKPLGTRPDEITAICRDATYDKCAG
ncbi:hypothetical protein ACNKHQ_00365 [Shigella flexneri]